MRLEARVQEGDQVRTALVPLRTVMAFPGAHDGRTINAAISDSDFVEWEPWVCWHATEPRDGRTLDDWVEVVDWCGIYPAPDMLDPSGGEATHTPPSSPESLSEPGAAGPSSSSSTSRSRTPSGRKSAAK